MRLLRGLHNRGLTPPGCVATIGNFDGFHLGHQAIVDRVKEEASRLALPSVVMIFEPQPLEYFSSETAPVRLMTWRDKFSAIETSGIDYLSCLKFDAALSKLTANEFIEQVLLGFLGVRHLVIGDDFRFGSDRQGDFRLLAQSGKNLGFTVENTPTFTQSLDSDARVSSTGVRNFIAESRFEDAAALLGRPFAIAGRVVHGKKLGRTLGFPTANVNLNRKKVPFSGVYAVELSLAPKGLSATEANDECWQGIANIGYKPTIDYQEPSLEVHVLDANPDLYGKRVSVRFVKKIRDEKKFAGLDELKAQIAKDVGEAKNYWSQVSV